MDGAVDMYCPTDSRAVRETQTQYAQYAVNYVIHHICDALESWPALNSLQ